MPLSGTRRTPRPGPHRQLAELRCQRGAARSGYPASGQAVRPPHRRVAGRARAASALPLLERHLAQHAWLAQTSAPTIADIAVYPNVALGGDGGLRSAGISGAAGVVRAHSRVARLCRHAGVVAAMNAHRVWTLGGRIRRLGALLLLALLATVASANAVAEGLRFSLVRTAQSEWRLPAAPRRLAASATDPAHRHPDRTSRYPSAVRHRVGAADRRAAGRRTAVANQALRRGTAGTRPAGAGWAGDRPHRAGLRALGACLRIGRLSGRAGARQSDSLDYLQTATPPAVLRSQFRHPIDWQPCSSIHGLISGTRRARTCSATDSWCWYRWPDTARLACT